MTTQALQYKPLFQSETSYTGFWNDADDEPDFDEVFVPFSEPEDDNELSLDIMGEGAEHLISEVFELHGFGTVIKLLLESSKASDFDKRWIAQSVLVNAIRAYRANRVAYIPGNRQGVWIRFNRTPRPSVGRFSHVQVQPKRANTFSVSTPSQAPKLSVLKSPFFIPYPTLNLKK